MGELTVSNTMNIYNTVLSLNKKEFAMSEKKHVPLPKNKRAFICADCGAVALDAKNICKIMGRVKKGDWCGIKGVKPPSFCHSKVNNERWQCGNCGQISVNSNLLCEPKKLAQSD